MVPWAGRLSEGRIPTLAVASTTGRTLLASLVGASATYDYSTNNRRLVSGINYSDLLLVVHPSVPARNMKELIDHVKANPGKLNFGATSANTQLTGEQIRMMGADEGSSQ